MKYPNIFSPIKIGPRTIPNRIFNPAHHTAFAAMGLMNERHAAYYEARAKGGVGMIITGIQNVVEEDHNNPPCTLDDEVLASGQVDQYKMVTEAVHKHGTVILAQLGNLGRQDWNCAGHMQAMPAASPIPVHGGYVPKELEIEEMETIKEQFFRAAKIVQEGGFDGMEIHMGYGYFLAGFLSPLSNQRSDQYGGPLENRLRFPLEILQTVHDALGQDLNMIVGVRLMSDDYLDGGVSGDEAVEIARRLEASGLVHYINATAGTYDNKVIITDPMFFPMGYAVGSAQAIKEVVDIPVLNAGRHKDPAMVESLVANGMIDMVGMARPLITDPDLPNKMLEGRESEIRNCIGCNQKCTGNLGVGVPISCMQNPMAGREYLPFWSELQLVERAKNIVIVGGGIAGCEAAITLVKRGHKVSIHERSDSIGGQLKTVMKAPGREEWQDVFRFHEREIARLGIELNLNSEMTEEKILALNPDEVVIATGSTARTIPYNDMPAIDGAEKLLSVRDVLDGTAAAGERVIVYAGDNHMQGLSVTELLLDQGKHVEIVCPVEMPGMQGEFQFVECQVERLLQKGLAGMHLHSYIKAFDGQKLKGVEGMLKHPFELECDTIVSTFGGDALSDLYFALKGKVSVHRIGDALAPRTADFAIFDGATIGREL